jgi:hypothetical protein
MKNEVNQTNTTYSLRSQRNLVREMGLRADLAKCEAVIGYTDRGIGELEADKARQVKARLSGTGGEWVGRTLEELEGKNRELVAYREQRDAIQTEIAKLAPSPAQAAERAQRQSYLAQIAADRLKKDELVEGALKGLRRLLEERGELTTKMFKAAEAADLTIGEDRLGSGRFEEVLGSLPEHLLAGSNQWHAWFIGKQQGVKPYVVVVEDLTFPESLARANLYRFGEKVELSDEEASELLREICPVGKATWDTSWAYEAPRIMAVEVFEEFLRKASGDIQTAQGLVYQWNQKREEKLKDQYAEEYQEALLERQEELRGQGLLHGGR